MDEFKVVRDTEKGFNLGGGDTGLLTLKHNPWAWFGP